MGVGALGPEGMFPLNLGPMEVVQGCVVLVASVLSPRDLLSLCLVLLFGTVQGMPGKISQLWVFMFIFPLCVALLASVLL